MYGLRLGAWLLIHRSSWSVWNMLESGSWRSPSPSHLLSWGCYRCVTSCGSALLFFSFWGRTCGMWKFPGYTTATTMPDPCCICDLRPSLWQRQILNPLREARGQTHVLMDTSRVHYC